MKVRVLGDPTALADGSAGELKRTGGVFQRQYRAEFSDLAINYGSRDEIVRAIRQAQCRTV